jgi:hypothetical protein
MVERSNYTGTKFITASIVDIEFITYENMYLLLLFVTHVITGLQKKKVLKKPKTAQL